jgi:hypothetical protein
LYTVLCLWCTRWYTGGRWASRPRACTPSCVYSKEILFVTNAISRASLVSSFILFFGLGAEIPAPTINVLSSVAHGKLHRDPEFDPFGVDRCLTVMSSILLSAVSTMERLFSPCTRYRDILELEGVRHHHEGFRELNLDVSTQEFLSAERAFTYADLYAMLGNGETVAWLTPHAAVAHENDRVVEIGGSLMSRAASVLMPTVK